jgi:hypothetical protein
VRLERIIFCGFYFPADQPLCRLITSLTVKSDDLGHQFRLLAEKATGVEGVTGLLVTGFSGRLGRVTSHQQAKWSRAAEAAILIEDGCRAPFAGAFSWRSSRRRRSMKLDPRGRRPASE